MSALAIKWGLIAAIAAALAGASWAIVHTYTAAIDRAESAETAAADLRDSLKDRDDALAAWTLRRVEWEAERKASADALAANEAERKARLLEFSRAMKDYLHGIENLPPVDRACADRTVPAAVDRLLDSPEAPAPAAR